jgi:hypothetical protein
MNYVSIFSAILAFLAPLLAKRGWIFPPEAASWFAALFVGVQGLIANGIRLGIRDLRTTLSGLLGAAFVGLASFGLDLSPEFQAAIIGIATTITAWFMRWPSTPLEMEKK